VAFSFFREDKKGSDLVFGDQKDIACCKQVDRLPLDDLHLAGDQPYQHMIREGKFCLVPVALGIRKLYVRSYIQELYIWSRNPLYKYYKEIVNRRGI
jgi:hypothetical protein